MVGILTDPVKAGAGKSQSRFIRSVQLGMDIVPVELAIE
jgi:hypothetical protein